MRCIYCNKSFIETRKRYQSSALKNHQARCTENPNRVLQTSKTPEETHKKIGRRTKEYFSNPDNRKKHSVIMSQAVLANPESYSDKNVVGRSKHFTVDGVRYNSTWEYEVSKYLNDKNIKWQRSKIKPIPYLWKNTWHLYFPDFFLPEHNIYLEVKGYETDRDREKWKQADKPILVVKQKEIDLIKKNCYDILMEVKSKSGDPLLITE